MASGQTTRRLAMVALLGCVLLLFVGGPDGYSSRSVRQGWQFGHVLLFFVATRLALPVLRSRLGVRESVSLVLLAAGLIGGLVEWLQGFVGREVSWTDVRLDVIGAALGLAGRMPTAPAAAPAPDRWWGDRRLPFLLAAIALVVLVWLEALPLGRTLLDEYRARRDFPVLVAWASELELDRVKADGSLRIDNAPGRPGERSLRIGLPPSAFAGFELQYFPGDWRGYGVLEITLRVPVGAPGSITCRVHDAAHDNRYADRFNRRFEVFPGWNVLALPLADIQRAPRGREMDIARVQGVGCFFVGLREGAELWVGKIALGMSPSR